ncbi:MAG: LamG domain-containing protein [Candidatus Moduliflexus flocculans]|nr:LamG domain-containing protein [Candidatus Moduliflexus flocculans]
MARVSDSINHSFATYSTSQGLSLGTGVVCNYAVVFDKNNNLQIYENATAKGTAGSLSNIGNISDTSTSFQLGICDFISDYAQFKINSVLFYNKALSASEIAQNYNAGLVWNKARNKSR